jgi:hypothetical protein
MCQRASDSPRCNGLMSTRTIRMRSSSPRRLCRYSCIALFRRMIRQERDFLDQALVWVWTKASLERCSCRIQLDYKSNRLVGGYHWRETCTRSTRHPAPQYAEDRPHLLSLPQHAPQTGLHTQPGVPAPQVPSSVLTPVFHGGIASWVVLWATAPERVKARTVSVLIMMTRCYADNGCVGGRSIWQYRCNGSTKLYEAGRVSVRLPCRAQLSWRSNEQIRARCVPIPPCLRGRHAQHATAA